MKRVACTILGVALIGALAAQVALAQVSPPVTIYLKSKKGLPLKDQVIADETVQGIKLKDTADFIPPDDILDVDYSNRIQQAATRIKYDNGAMNEKEAAKATTKQKRIELLEAAITKYQETLAEMPKELLTARQHVEFKIAYVTGQLGLGSEKQIYRFDGIKRLTEYKKTHADSWQFTPAMFMLLRLHAEQKEFAEMRADAKELAAANVPARVKGEARMLVARNFMDAGKALQKSKPAEAGKQFAEAEKELKDLLLELPKDSAIRLPAELALTQCKAITGGNKAEVIQELKGLLDKVKEKETRGIVYNTLGEIYYQEGQLQEARWQFLWVDVIYNQDKEEHAKALYYLWKIFNQLSEPERGAEFFEALASSRLAGTYFQQKALKENKES